MIQADAVAKTYRMGQVDVPALRGVHLSIEAGEFVAVMGPSGSGKSTLMNLIGGLDRPTAGSLRVADREVATLTDAELSQLRARSIGFVFQSFHLIPRLSARDNVALALEFGGDVPRRQQRQRAEERLAQVGLAERVGHRPSELSGGEQQRVAIARALANDPPLVLADEPTGNLDTATGASILELLAELNRQGRTVVVVTHDPQVASYAERTVRLVDGRRTDAEEVSPADERD